MEGKPCEQTSHPSHELLRADFPRYSHPNKQPSLSDKRRLRFGVGAGAVSSLTFGSRSATTRFANPTLRIFCNVIPSKNLETRIPLKSLKLYTGDVVFERGYARQGYLTLADFTFKCAPPSLPPGALRNAASTMHLQDLCFACAAGELAGAVKNLVMHNTHNRAEPLSERRSEP